ncbi:cytochrome c oxidase assembly protein [Allohahella marinimesophila]|uniref:Cytochrome c oxidase assembly protein CtaG n=1 Tax=Allohahella marinimesophila TaxID=1054972 RepID=A0ABP7PCZ2_9GAMM
MSENNEQPGNSTPPRSHAGTVRKLLFVVVAMFGFGFALVPLYDLFCDITGINGKTNGRYEGEISTAVPGEGESRRVVRVQFTTSNNANMPWIFNPPENKQMDVVVGEPVQVDFFARNPTDRFIVAQAIPSVAPSKGADYFHKTECFCFQRQELEAGADTLMGLRFFIDRDLPEDIKTLTLSYTMFEVQDHAGL